MKRAALLLLAMAACGSDVVDLTGIYRVDTAVSSEPCGADAPVAMPPLFLKLTKEEFFGSDYFSLDQCTDRGGTDCSGGGLFGDSFSVPIDDGWRGVVSSWSSGGSASPTCTLFYSESTALLSGKRLVVESTDYSDEVENTEVLCTTDEAQARADAMPCIKHEKYEATQL